MTDPACPRKSPCASCPYRKGVPSGVWHESEYDKLPLYDGETWGQSTHAFLCHQGDGDVCSGWLGHRDPYDLLAVRLGVSAGTLDESCLDYRTPVPLFASGAEAGAHGKAQITTPSPKAEATIEKILKKRGP